jgi:hypothetical protein
MCSTLPCAAIGLCWLRNAELLNRVPCCISGVDSSMRSKISRRKDEHISSTLWFSPFHDLDQLPHFPFEFCVERWGGRNRTPIETRSYAALLLSFRKSSHGAKMSLFRQHTGNRHRAHEQVNEWRHNVKDCRQVCPTPSIQLNQPSNDEAANNHPPLQVVHGIARNNS